MEGDNFILIGSDGLFDRISSQEAVNFLLSELLKDNNLEKAIDKLITEANKRGTDDNITAIVIFLEEY